MSDLINRQQAIDVLEEQLDYLFMLDKKNNPTAESKWYGINWARNTIAELPTAEPKVGKWIPRDWTDIECPERLRRYKCSVCGKGPVTIVTDGELVGGYGAEAIDAKWEFKTEVFFSNYCSYCGAKMEGKRNDDG